MNLFLFTVHFTDEQSCRIHFKKQRDTEAIGIKSELCNRSYYWRFYAMKLHLPS